MKPQLDPEQEKELTDLLDEYQDEFVVCDKVNKMFDEERIDPELEPCSYRNLWGLLKRNTIYISRVVEVSRTIGPPDINYKFILIPKSETIEIYEKEPKSYKNLWGLLGRRSLPRYINRDNSIITQVPISFLAKYLETNNLDKKQYTSDQLYKLDSLIEQTQEMKHKTNICLGLI